MDDGAFSSNPAVRPEPGTEDYEELPEISGTWTSKDVESDPPADGFAGPDFDAAGWEETTSPVAPRTGVRRFRKSFHTQAEAAQRHWLTIDPLPVDTSVWLDGAYIGDAERSIVAKVFDVTHAIERKDDHLLALQMTASDEREAPPAHVRLFNTGQVCITRMKVLCVEASEDAAVLDMWAELDAGKPVTVTVRTAVEDSTETVDTIRSLSTGRNRLHWTVHVDNPALWWPRNLGAQPLRQVEVTVVDNTNKRSMSDARVVSVGFRSARKRGEHLVVNGMPVAVRAVDAGADFDFDTVASGITTLLTSERSLSPRLLYTADKAGLMVIAYASSDSRRAREAVEAYGSHPSLVAWRPSRAHLASVRVGHAGQAVRSLHRADPSRPHAPLLPHIGTAGELDELRRRGKVSFSVSPGVMPACHLVRVVTELRRAKNSQHIDMYVVNDSTDDIADGVISLDVTGQASDIGAVHKSWGGDAPAGAVTFVGSLDLPLLAARAELTVEVSLLSRTLAITRTVTHTTGSDGMILDVATRTSSLAARSAAGVARTARSFRELTRAGRHAGQANSEHNNERPE